MTLSHKIIRSILANESLPACSISASANHQYNRLSAASGSLGMWRLPSGLEAYGLEAASESVIDIGRSMLDVGPARNALKDVEFNFTGLFV